MSEIPDTVIKLLRQVYPQSFTANSLSARFGYSVGNVQTALNLLVKYKMAAIVQPTTTDSSGNLVPVTTVDVQYQAIPV